MTNLDKLKQEVNGTPQKIGEDRYSEHWSLDGNTYIQVPKWVIDHIATTLADELVERLEGERFEWLSSEEIKAHPNCRYKKDGLFVGQIAGYNYNQVITKAQTLIRKVSKRV